VTSEMVQNLIEENNDFDYNALSKTELYIITLDRDSATKNANKREIKKNFYRLGNNTAYQSINNRERSGTLKPLINLKSLINNRDYFLNNNLAELEKQGGYFNESENWKEFYNATLVVPISRGTSQKNESGIYGFLTIDCLNSKGREIFSKEDTLPILLFGAELLALIFLNLDLYDVLQSTRHNGE
jgi:hypothetical protein